MEEFAYKQMKETQSCHWWYLSRRKILDKALEKHVGSCNDILDIGGGMGGNIELLKKYGSLTIFEKNKYAVEYLSTLDSCHVIQGSFPESIDKHFPNFDLITMFDVLEHIKDDQIALEKIYKLMKKGNKLIITVPAYQFLFSHHDIVFHHYRRYNMQEILSKVQTVGFDVRHHTYFNTILFPIALISRIISKLSPKIQNHEQNIHKSKSNLILEKIFSLEKHLINRFRLPYGLSILLILEKKNG